MSEQERVHDEMYHRQTLPADAPHDHGNSERWGVRCKHKKRAAMDRDAGICYACRIAFEDPPKRHSR